MQAAVPGDVARKGEDDEEVEAEQGQAEADCLHHFGPCADEERRVAVEGDDVVPVKGPVVVRGALRVEAGLGHGLALSVGSGRLRGSRDRRPGPGDGAAGD